MAGDNFGRWLIILMALLQSNDGIRLLDQLMHETQSQALIYITDLLAIYDEDLTMLAECVTENPVKVTMPSMQVIESKDTLILMDLDQLSLDHIKRIMDETVNLDFIHHTWIVAGSFTTSDGIQTFALELFSKLNQKLPISTKMFTVNVSNQNVFQVFWNVKRAPYVQVGKG